MKTYMKTYHTSPDLFDNPTTLLVPVFRVELVKERMLNTPIVTSPDEVGRVLCRYLQRADREHFVVVMLSTANQIIGISTVSIGSLSASIVNMRETFKAPVLANAASVVFGHNHPSGAPRSAYVEC